MCTSRLMVPVWISLLRAEGFLCILLFRRLSQPFQVFSGSDDREGSEEGRP